MKKRSLIIIFIILISKFMVYAGPYDYVPADRKEIFTHTKIFKENITILPEQYLRGYDPITIFFSKPIEKVESGPEDYPEKYLKIRPFPEGEFRWIDNKTLQFKPVLAWPPLTKYKIIIKNKVKDLYTMMEAPAKVEPYNETEKLENIEVITLYFRNYVDPIKLKEAILFEIRQLPGITTENTKWISKDDFYIKSEERKSVKDFYKYNIFLKKQIGTGIKLILNLALSVFSETRQTLVKYAFFTKEPFRIKSVGTSNIKYPLTANGIKYSKEQILKGYVNDRTIYVNFSDDFFKPNFSAFKKFINFTPSVSNLKYYQGDKCLKITGDFRDELQYKITLNPVIIYDLKKRKLDMKGGSELYFYFPAEKPFIKWKQSKGILERFGYQKIPISARKEEAIDLRLYRIDPKSMAFLDFPSYPVKINESQTPPRPGEEPTSISDLKNHIRMLEMPVFSQIVKLPSAGKANSMDFGLDLKKILKNKIDTTKAGTYLLGYRRLNSKNIRSYVKFQITDLCLTTIEEKTGIKFLVTSLQTGEPIEGAEIKLQVKTTSLEPDATELSDAIKGKTDDDGMFYWEHKHESFRDYSFKRIVVNKKDDILVLPLNNPPSNFVNNHWYRSSSNWFSWIKNEPYDYEQDEFLCGHIITERPVYKPGEKVYIKGYIRHRQHGKIYKFNDELDYQIQISGPGNKIWKYKVLQSEYGSFDYIFDEKKIPTGNYTVKILDIRNQDLYAETTFKVEAYKIPKFEVNIHAPDRVAMDKKFSVKLTADYYAGGNVVDEQVEWKVSQFPYIHHPKEMKDYIFFSDNKFSRNLRFRSTGTVVKNCMTDDLGFSKIVINPTLEIDGNARLYVIEASVTGADNQIVTATRKVKALSSFLLGMKVERYIKNDKIISPKIVCLDVYDKFKENVDITVRIFKREWHTHLQETDFSNGKPKYISEPVDIKIEEKKIKSLDKPNELDFFVKDAGIYLIEAEAHDKLGRIRLVTTDVFVSGKEEISWEKSENQIFKTSTDKSSYNPGDKATVVIRSPYNKARVLAVIEDEKKPEYKIVEVVSGKAEFSFEIKKNYTPKIPVHFILWKGRNAKYSDDSKQIKYDMDKPATLASTKWIKVNPVNNKLKVEIKHSEKALPGQEVEFIIKLKDYYDKPVNGEVTLWLVDQAVLSLGREKSIDPLNGFIKQRESKIIIRDIRNKIVGDLFINEHPGGDGGADDEIKNKNSIFDNVTVRKNFKVVPYYNPNILVNDSGEVKLKIKMPDNLTNFKIRAMAVSGEDKFGSFKSQISIRLPLIVQSSLPRFVRIGDNFLGGGIGRIIEGDSGLGRCEIKVDGLTVAGDTVTNIIWQKNKAHKLYFPLFVNTPPSIDFESEKFVGISFAVFRNSDQAKDAFKIKLPLKNDRKNIKIEEFFEIKPGENIEFKILEDKWRKNTFRQKLVVSNNLKIIKMASALGYLINYPYGCTEQKVSKTFAAVALKGLLGSYNLFPVSYNVDKAVNETLYHLKNTLNSNGLYGYWPGCRGYVYLTAYVLEFLAEAKKAGYEIADELIYKSKIALKNALRTNYSYFIDGSSLFERTAAIYTLSKFNYTNKSYARELFHNSKYMSLFDISKLLMAGQVGKNYDKKINEELKDALWNHSIFKLRDNKEVFAGIQFKNDKWGGIINSSEAQTMSNIIRALYATDSQNPKIKFMIKELVRLGKKDGWGSTSSNVSALLALRDIMQTPDKGLKKAKFIVTSKSGNSEKIILNKKHSTITYIDNQSEIKNVFRAEEKKDTSLLYLRYTKTYIPEKTGDLIEQKNNGFVVSRELIKISKSDTIPSEKIKLEHAGQIHKFKIGDIVEEHIEVINPAERHFVVISSPLAAGFEPMNPNLAISSKNARPDGKNTLEPSYVSFLDDQVNYFYEYLPKGTYHFYYRVRTMTEGSFVQPPAFAQLMYEESKYGISNGTRIMVEKNIEN